MKKNNKILLARHAESEHNIYTKDAVFAGNETDSELSEEGKKGAEKLSREIIEIGGCDIILCSPLKRSRDTAEIIARKIDLTIGKTPIIKRAGNLREISAGLFTGKTRSYVLKHYPQQATDFYDGNIEKWDFPQGENYAQVLKRAKDVLSAAQKYALSGQRVLLVGHGMFNRVLLSFIYPDKKELWQPTAYPHDRLIKLKI